MGNLHRAFSSVLEVAPEFHLVLTWFPTVSGDRDFRHLEYGDDHSREFSITLRGITLRFLGNPVVEPFDLLRLKASNTTYIERRCERFYGAHNLCKQTQPSAEGGSHSDLLANDIEAAFGLY